MNHRNNLQKLVSSTLKTEDFNKALRYIDSKKFDKAAAIFKRQLKDHNFKELWVNLGVAYKGMGNYDKVKECFLKAVDPHLPFSDGKFVESYSLGLSNLGLIAYTFEHDEVAVDIYKQVLAKEPLYYDALWNLAVATLRRFCSGKPEDLSLAWHYYTYRFKRTGALGLKCDKEGIKIWNKKEEHLDSSIVVLIEQGMGDSFMFGRYLSEVQKYFKHVYVQCTPEMNYVFSDYKTCTHVSETDAEYAIPIGSLGMLLDYIPRGDWLKHKYIPKVSNGKLDIGVVWNGNPDHANDANRSCLPGYFDRLKKYGNLYTIGPNPRRKGYTHLEAKTWEDTIKQFSKLDMVISIDSSIVHACGSLGMPCWLLQPKLDTDFRWGDSSAGWNNIWYDSVDVFRNPNDWEKVFNNVEKRLEYAISNR